MALPSAGYASAAISNPSSALTDFSLIVDLSRMPSSWWSDVNTSDGTRGRACKGDGTTELACDWIDFDNSGETGLLRVKWSGSLASSGTQTLRIYAPNTRNSAYAATATYGSDNAYDSSTEGCWPLHDGNDRTSNGNDMTGYGSVSFGGATGNLGDATQFTASSSQYALADTFDFTGDFTFSGLVYLDSVDADNGVMGVTGGAVQLWMDNFSPDRFGFYASSSVAYGSTAPSTGTWYHVGGSKGSSTITLYVDGSSEDTDAPGSLFDTEFAIGRASTKYGNGRQQHVTLSSATRSAAWFDEEASQLLDQSTFWGSWSWSSGGTSYTLTAESGSYTYTGTAADLLRGYLVSAESGSFTVTGSEADLLRGYLIAADSGSYTLTGQDADLLRGYGITAESGSFTVTGSEVSLLRGYRLNAEGGVYVLTGQDAGLIYTPVGGYTLTAEGGTFTLTGSDVALQKTYLLSAEGGAYTVSGDEVTLNKGFTLTAEAGEFTVTGQDADFLRGYVLNAETGEYVLTGQDVALSYGALFVPVERVTIKGGVTMRRAINGAVTQSQTIKGAVTQRLDITGEV